MVERKASVMIGAWAGVNKIEMRRRTRRLSDEDSSLKKCVKRKSYDYSKTKAEKTT